jgi:hypothetical protein
MSKAVSQVLIKSTIFTVTRHSTSWEFVEKALIWTSKFQSVK